jgi:uncharacterized SAM-binding protein YcdF (DUF218 family)
MSCAKRCLSLLFFGLLILCAIAAAALYSAARWLHHADAPQKADAIVVLAGDYSRPFEGARLYREGYAPKVYLSEAVREPSVLLLDREGIIYARNDDLIRQIALQKGVPPDAAIWLARDMTSTASEAEATRALVKNGAKKLLIVTSPYHTRRTGIIFRHALPDADIRIIASRYEEFPEDWWHSQRAAINVLLEIAKLGYYWVGGRF